ncbi:MAG: hypothetical protein GY740_00010, partial [Gammaproteobacteria bacterium]|nr:hypothetical protein [Gammaproteobacteria bacterium]
RGLHWWRSLLEACGANSDFVPGVEYKAFLNGCSIFCVNTVAERLSRRYATPYSVGRCELQLDFKKPLSRRLFVMVAGVFSDTITLDRSAMIGLTYIPGNF